MLRFLITSVLLLATAPLLPGQPWRSALYPATGHDPSAANFETDKVIQDFSYAGYRRGAALLPDVTGPIFNVTTAPYNADPTGTTDATSAIQAAINAAGAQGGGVVFLPAGTYRVSVGTKAEALLIENPHIVLRGAGVEQTFILNTSITNMRSKAVIRIRGSSNVGFWAGGSSSTALASDLLRPTTVIPVVSTSAFSVGDTVVVRNTTTEAWIAEHNEPNWTGLANNSSLAGLTYRRTVVAIDPIAKTLTIDAPTRYALKLRDNARVVRLSQTPLIECGLEDFSVGNLQNPSQTWFEEDNAISGTAGYEVTGCFFIMIERARDCWVRRLSSYQPAGNTSTAHLLSGGINIRESTHVTIDNCSFSRPQYGGGGGSGYMYRLINTGECLIQNSEARFSRHGFMFSGMGSSGNVIYNCLDAETGRATGATGSYVTSGKGSDHHMHFSQSNLVDTCTATDSWFEARYRGTSGTVPHGLAATHSVFWNLRGTGTISDAVVKAEQARYGYVIGTRGNRSAVELPRLAAAGTDPIDHVEGAGQGDTLEPFSLFQEQRSRRLGASATLPESVVLPFPANSAELAPTSFTVAGQSLSFNQVQVAWEANAPVQLTPLPAGAVLVRVPGPGEWLATCATTYAGNTRRQTVRLLAEAAAPTVGRTLLVVADTYSDGSTAQLNTNYGTEATLRLKKAANANTTRHGFLRFDLTPLGGDLPLSATLVLTAERALATYAGWEVGVHPVTSAWQENTLTWNNSPTVGAALATYLPSPELRDVIDVTNPLLAAWGAAAPSLDFSLRVVSQPDTTLLYYHSREQANAALRPQIELAVIPAAQRYTQWIAARPGVAADKRNLNDDPDGDGIPNLIEMLLGRDPAVPEAAPALEISSRTATVSFTFAYPAPAMTRLTLEQSIDLAAWTALGITTAHISQLAGGFRHVNVPVDFSGAAKFWRLRIDPESGTTIP
ncbi:MAG: DNRLRE domain-containing protein [Candidatus Didemnitutus sp.]|nr:DNRLRE domain-containing protein [Candidatus Didemnitutus sp.]